MVGTDLQRWMAMLQDEAGVSRWRVLAAAVPVPATLVASQAALGRNWWAFVLFRDPELRQEALASFPEWWFTLTRFTYVLVHLRGQFFRHLLGNSIGIFVLAALLYLVFAATGRRLTYWTSYLGLFVLAPPLTSIVYLSMGEGMYGLGASGVALAYAGLLATTLVWYVAERLVPELQPIHALSVPALGVLAWAPDFALLGPTLVAAAGVVGYSGWRGLCAVRNAREIGSTPETRIVGTTFVACVSLPVADAMVGSNVGHQFGYLIGASYGVALFTLVQRHGNGGQDRDQSSR